jgi:riboflavin biosynthesis pyrimidine reductase
LLALAAGADGRVKLEALLERLAEMGVASLMVEGGAEVIASFLTGRLFDQVVVTVAPVYTGGLHLPLEMGKLVRLREAGGERLGEDWVLWGRRVSDD